jgi:hypothetical protein
MQLSEEIIRPINLTRFRIYSRMTLLKILIDILKHLRNKVKNELINK